VTLVTKAVSEYFGGGGIADQMIKFNGYPFLEKEDKEDGDHAFTEPSECCCLHGARGMKLD
jgi:chloride channel 3/4/5